MYDTRLILLEMPPKLSMQPFGFRLLQVWFGSHVCPAFTLKGLEVVKASASEVLPCVVCFGVKFDLESDVDRAVFNDGAQERFLPRRFRLTPDPSVYSSSTS